jgi:threonine aldolase
MNMNRRFFLRASGLSVLPAVLPTAPGMAALHQTPPVDSKMVNFMFDGDFLNPGRYIEQLQEIQAAKAIERDVYGGGGSVAELEKKFAAITGKEKAIYMPSGTLANQLAIHVLCGNNTKVFVQETSHVYRDEADAAQAVFNKRLMPVAKGEAAFTLEELQAAIDYHNNGEVFRSGIGVVSIENPVRRCDGKQVPVTELQRISAWCRGQGYKLHLDGARLFMASMYSGVSIAAYARLFDTVYISLYKYLGATGGAILCGDKTVIDQMPHLIKIHGGNAFGNWTNTAVASFMLDGLETRLTAARKQSEELFRLLEPIGIKVAALPNGSNIHMATLSPAINVDRLADTLLEKHNIRFAKKNKAGLVPMTINETILYRDNQSFVQSFAAAIKGAS